MEQPRRVDLLAEVFPKIEKDQDRWAQVLYSEVWKQLAHQDQVANARANVFLAVQAALFAILLVGSPAILRVGCAKLVPFEPMLHLGSLLVGITWVLVGILLLVHGRYFRRVTEAGEQYVRFRHAHLRVLEELSLGYLGPALAELRWRQHSKLCKQRYRPFGLLRSEHEEITAAASTEVDAFNHFGGYPYLYHVLSMWQRVYWVVLLVGSMAAFLGLAFSTLATRFGIQIEGFRC